MIVSVTPLFNYIRAGLAEVTALSLLDWSALALARAVVAKDRVASALDT